MWWDSTHFVILKKKKHFCSLLHPSQSLFFPPKLCLTFSRGHSWFLGFNSQILISGLRLKPQLSTVFSLCMCVCLWGTPLKARRGRGMLIGLKMERGGVHCCHRNTKCELQSEAKANLYIGRHQTPWEPYMLCVCVGVFKYLKRAPL